MARIAQDGFEGQADSNNQQNLEIDALSHDTIEVPSSEFISNSDISREGQDLVLETADGDILTINNYFSVEDAPLIESTDGSILTGNLVNSFLSSESQYAQSNSANDESPIGAIEEISGEATIIRTDGTSEPLTLGTPVYQGDTIETSEDGAVNIVFIDETSMAVSESAKLSLDEYQFDPSTESGTTNLSVLRGVFVFTSGLIGRDDPDDVKIDTPVGSIGIRGTIIAGNINPGGESEITVVEGAIVIQNGLMETTLSEQYETISLNGFRSEMQNIGVQKAERMKKSYGSVQDVLPKLFSSINDNIKQERKSLRDARKNEDQEDQKDILEAEEEIKKEEVREPKVEDKPEITVQPVIEPNFDANAGKFIFFKIKKIIKTFLQKFFDRFDLDRPDINPDDPINPDALETPELEINNTPARIIEGSDANTVFMRVSAEGGEQGGVTFKFSNGTNTDGNYIIEQINGRQAAIKLVSGIGLVGGATVTSLDIIATDSAGNTRTINFTPTVIDAAVNLIGAGGLDYDITGNVSATPKSIGNFDGDVNGTIETATIGSTTDKIAINGVDTINALTGLNQNSFDGVGDINNDGYDDFVYGAHDASVGGFVNLVTGNNSNDMTSPSSIAVSADSTDDVGYAVAGTGDFNGDGKLDFAYSIIGADTGGTDRGKIIIQHDGFTQEFAGGTNGMKLGSKIDGLGDVNGDGLSDIITTALNVSNEAYIYQGTTNSTPTVTATINTGSDNIVAIGGAKDINGDGFNDIAVSVKMGADVNTFVIFGKNGLSGTIDMTYLEDPANTLKIHHAGAGTTLDSDSSLNYQITGLDDINGDGFDDIQVGISGQSQFNVHGQIAGDNVPYAQDGTATDGSGSQTNADGWLSPHNAGVKSLVGDVNFMDNSQTDLSMKGGGSSNTFDIQNTSFKNIDGGKGVDTIRYDNAGPLDFSNVKFEQISQIEHIELGSSSAITLTAENIFNLLKTSDNGSLKIDGVTGSNLQIVNSDSADATGIHNRIMEALDEAGAGAGAATHNTATAGYDHYQVGGYNLYIDTDVATNVV